MEGLYQNNVLYSRDDSQQVRISILFSLFWAGFILYTVIYTLTIVGFIGYSHIIIIQIGQFSGLTIMIFSSVFLIRLKLESTYLTVVYYLYLFWLFVVLARGMILDTEFIKTSLLDASFGFLIYFVPLIMLFPRQVRLFRKVFLVIILLGIVYLLLDLYFLKELLYPYGGYRYAQTLVEYFSRNLSLPAGFILLTYLYHTDKKNLFALLIIAVTFLISAVRARRSLMFASMLIMIFSYLVFFFTNKGKIFKIILSVIIVISLVIYAGYLFYLERSSAFTLLSARLHEDTRSGVINNFFNDMSTIDWIIGKGSNGQYYCPGIDEGFRITTHRGVIENGLYQVILKQGILGLAFFIAIALPAIIKGLFKSQNLLSRAAALWILLFIINLFVSVGNAFIMYYLLTWISIGICFDSSIRSKSDSEIIEQLN